MKTNRNQSWTQAVSIFCILTMSFWLSVPALAKDTDIYSVNPKQNCYILMDSSGSMRFGVYEHTIDYYEMFRYLFTLNDAGSFNDYIYDTVNNSDYFFTHHEEARKIYLWLGRIGATIANVNGNPVAFSGDAADPDYLWFSNNLVDTHTVIDVNGNLADDGTGQRRITVDANGYILLDGTRLPLGLDIKAHDFVTLYNGTVVDNGFNGLLNAPGYYFSGYEGVTVGALDQVESGDQDVYFFVTGNWANMQAMYNLHYTTNNPTPQDASQGDAAWVYEHFPISEASWPQINHNLDYPAGAGNYTNNLTEVNTAQSITRAGAEMIQIHFSAFDVQGNNNAGTFNKDYLKLYDKAGNVVAQYDNDNNPANVNGGWSVAMAGDTATLKLYSDNSDVGTGYTIDKIRISYISGGAYLMQSRMDVAKDALTYTVNNVRGKMNWGFASFNNGDGAQLWPLLDPAKNDEAQRMDMINQINNVSPLGGTPLMEALQDVWDEGYYGRRNVLNSLLCRKNYVISMTDGFPSVDDDDHRIGGVAAFTDSDGDGWTQDPYQGLGDHPDYYDDVAHWMYTHSWLDKSPVTDPANSYTNVITHHIAFGAKHPLLQDAAEESGGEYITAYNKEQLVAAFYSLALMMSESVSFTAPVVSVDAVNKIQSGDDLYMGLFLPQDSDYWAGNLKKFKLGDGSAARPKTFMIYDAADHEAVNNSGEFVDDTAAFWGNDIDVNDTDHLSQADILEDGTGELLLEAVQGYLAAGAITSTAYWNRPIYTYKGGAKVKFDRTNITAADLGINTGDPTADNVTRDKIINFTHGYTYDANATTGAPSAVRDWVLGAIVHSRPVVVDYFNTADVNLPLLKRLVVIGSNDGMLHVFDDTTGNELLAFIPEDMLPKLKNIAQDGVIKKTLVDSVDGLITLYRRAQNPKYLIFGERRGGGYYWNLDVTDQNPANWTVAWSYTNAEIEQSWSEVKVASIPVSIDTNGVRAYKDVAIFTGGYDPEEDFFPEPFTDQDSNGTPYMANGNIDNSEWSQAEATQDVYNDNNYNKYNPKKNEQGRGIYVVDIDNPAAVTNVTLADSSIKQILPFSVTSVPYSNEQAAPDNLTTGAAQVTTGAAQTLTEMKFSFPASPSVVTGTDKYFYYNTGTTKYVQASKENVLRSLYAIDVYANLFKVRLAFDLVNANPNGVIPYWETSIAAWKVNKVFSANPGSLSGSGKTGGGAATGSAADEGRKAFYPPSISWGGSKGLFEAKNYNFIDTVPDPDISITFDTKDKMASLFFGTGDRENPKYTMIRNRFYAVYDDSSVTAKEVFPFLVAPTNVTVTSAPYYEDDLLNLTCDELGKNSIINSCYLGNTLPDGTTCTAGTADVDMKRYLNTLLTDDAVYGTTPALENGATHENDAKGWYITLPDQGKTTVCGHMTYPTTISSTTSSSHDNHDGEQVLSQALLYYGTLYFTTYQAPINDPCNPQGNGFAYSLNYLNGSATYNLNAGTNIDITDRYKKFTGITGIPSGFALIIRKGDAAALANMGGALIGPAPSTLNDPLGSNINDPGAGLELYYWRDSNSQQP